MLLAAAGPIAPPWIVLPIVSVAMIVVAAHTLAIQSVQMPASRRRLRTVNGILMLMALPLFGYAAAIATMADKRLFVIAWIAVMALVGIVILLALLDMANNVRLYGQSRSELDRIAAEALAERFARHGPTGKPGHASGGGTSDER